MNFQFFDMNLLKPNPRIIIIGRRDTGKTFLTKDIMHHFRDVPIATVVSGTEYHENTYSQIVPPELIHLEWHTDIVENVRRRQTSIMKQCQREFKHDSNAKKKDCRALFILDNCMYDMKWVANKSMKWVMFNNRCLATSIIHTMSYPLGMPPMWRANLDWVFLFRDPIIGNRKRVHDSYASMFPTFSDFSAVMDKIEAMDTLYEGYHCLVIKNNAKSLLLEEQVFFYKAADHGVFRMNTAIETI